MEFFENFVISCYIKKNKDKQENYIINNEYSLTSINKENNKVINNHKKGYIMQLK
jgi:hypothetical protein